MNATSLIKTMEVSGHTIDALLPFCPRKRSAIYLHLKDDPMPLWLWETLEKWHAQNGPLSPPPIEKTFAWMMAKAWRKIVPVCRYELKAGRPRNDDDGDEPNDGPRGRGRSRKEEGFLPRVGENPQSHEEVSSHVVGQNSRGVACQKKPSESLEVQEYQDWDRQSARAKSITDQSKDIAEPLSKSSTSSFDTTGASSQKSDLINSEAMKISGFSPQVSEVEELWKTGLLCDEVYAAKVLRQIAALSPVPRDLMASFKADVARQGWAYRWKESCRAEKAYRYLAKKAGVSLRSRGKDAEVQARNARWLSEIGPAIAWFRKNSTQAKGAHDNRSFGFRREMIVKALENPQVLERLADPETGVVPTVAQIEKICRDAGWKIDSRNEPDDFVQRTIGWRPKFAGDVILVDWTGLPLKVNGQVFEVLNKRTGGKDRKHKKFGLHIAVDAATNYTWIDETYGDNEYATWPRFLRKLLFRDLGYRPRVLVMDKVSGVVTSLLNGSPDDKRPNVMAEVLMWVAAGVNLHVHLPEHANAKGHVEVAAKLIKHRELHGLTVRAALEKHMRGELVKPRESMSHADVLRMIPELQRSANSRMLHRDGYKLGTREELWPNAEDKSIRDGLALAPDAEERALEIVSKAKLVWVNGSTATLRVDGKKHLAEIHGFEEAGISSRFNDARAWIVPPLPGVGVDEQQYRVCLIEPGTGLPKFHALTASVSKKDRFAYDEMRPFMGEGYRAIAATNAEKTKSVIDLSESAWKQTVAARRDGTTGQEVSRSFE